MEQVVRACAAVGVALWQCGALYAQVTPPPSGPGMDRASNADGEIVVTAQKRVESIQRVPISIQAFGQKDLRSLGISSSTDLGKFTPNVDIGLPAGEGNQPIVVIRGIGLNDSNTNNAGPNGIYVDEVYLSAPSSQTFQTFDLQRVEVLKGPQGTLYGRNSSGGAINFITNKPTDILSADLHTSFGSFNTYNVEAAISGPLTPNLDARLAVTKSGSDGYVHNDLTGQRENGANSGALRTQFLWKPSADLQILLNGHAGHVKVRPNEYRHVATFDPTTLGNATPTVCGQAGIDAGACTDIFGTGTPANFYHGSYNRHEKLDVTSAGGSLRVSLTSAAVDLTSLTSFEHNDKFHPEDSDASPLRLLEQNFAVNSNTFTQEVRAAHTGDQYNWVAGLYYLHETLKQAQSVDLFLDGDLVVGVPGAFDGIALRGFGNSRQLTNAYAAFGQVEYGLTDRLRLVAGGRFTHETKSFDYLGRVQYQSGGIDSFTPLSVLGDTNRSLSNSKFSFRAGLNYTIKRDVLAYASIATGFKSGGFNGGFLSTNPIELDRQLQPIRPENVTTYEVGLKSSLFERRLVLNAALFYNDYRNLQVSELISPVVPGGNIVSVLDNAPRAHTEGLDLSLVVKPVERLTLTGQLGLLSAKVDDFRSTSSLIAIDYSHNRLALAPRSSALLIAEYHMPVGRNGIDAQVSAAYKSHQFFDISNDPLAAQNGYWLENARLAFQFRNDEFEIAAFVHNFTDRKYYAFAFDLTNPFGFVQGVTGTPRTVGVEANFHY